MPVFSRMSIMSLPLEVLECVLDLLSMPSLLSFGRTCLDASVLVSSMLKRDRNCIIRQYFPAVENFLFLLTSNRAVITGEAALAFLVRDLSLLTQELEVCVSCDHSDDLLQDFERQHHLEHAWSDDVWPHLDYNRTTEFLYTTPGRMRIRVICSYTPSPFTPFASYPTSALFNYMDEFSFGCAYRNLTMNRRAVVPAMAGLGLAAQMRVVRLSNQGGFDQSPCPAEVAFPPVPFTAYNRFAYLDDPNREEWINTSCLRRMGLCPGQPRYFGDRSSLVEFFEPDMVDYVVMAHCNFPPYGQTAVWRMDGSTCDYDCEAGDFLIGANQSGVCAVATELSYGAFTSRVAGQIEIGESQHCRVWNAGIDAIKLPQRGVYWGTPGHPAYLP